MFHKIPESIRLRMRELEEADTLDRQDGTPQSYRLRQIPPVTGRFLALMAAGAPDGKIVEIGTSAGYSTMWLSLAARAKARQIATFEVLDHKAALARETFAQAGIEDIVELIHGDARQYLPRMQDIAYCFLDAEKDIYEECYDLAIPNTVSGGVLLADNVINHADILGPFVERAAADNRVDAVVVPIGNGLLFCRKI